jgi:hypothetical protein
LIYDWEGFASIQRRHIQQQTYAGMLPATGHDVETSVQFNVADSRHLTSVSPYFSACGLDTTLSGGLPGFGIGAIPASQLAQCQAWALVMLCARMMKDFVCP